MEAFRSVCPSLSGEVQGEGARLVAAAAYHSLDYTSVIIGKLSLKAEVNNSIFTHFCLTFLSITYNIANIPTLNPDLQIQYRRRFSACEIDLQEADLLSAVSVQNRLISSARRDAGGSGSKAVATA